MTGIASSVILSVAKDLYVALSCGVEGSVLPYTSMQPPNFREAPIKILLSSLRFHKKREPFKGMTLNEIRRRPTLPGRFQPSTISVLRLNFCVRDGRLPLKDFASEIAFCFPLHPASGFAPSKPHRLVSLPLSDQDSFRSPSHSLTNFLRGFGSGLRFRFPPLAFARFRPPIAYSLLPIASSLPRSSPRPISIIKLHTLPHFHR